MTRTEAEIETAIFDAIEAFHTAAQGKGREAMLLAVGGLVALERLAMVLLGEEHPTTLALTAARAMRDVGGEMGVVVELAVVDADGDEPDGERWS
jgi:hypothetical protein